MVSSWCCALRFAIMVGLKRGYLNSGVCLYLVQLISELFWSTRAYVPCSLWWRIIFAFNHKIRFNCFNLLLLGIWFGSVVHLSITLVLLEILLLGSSTCRIGPSEPIGGASFFWECEKISRLKLSQYCLLKRLRLGYLLHMPQPGLPDRRIKGLPINAQVHDEEKFSRCQY